MGKVVQRWQLSKTSMAQHILRRKDIKYAILMRDRGFDSFLTPEKSRGAYKYRSTHLFEFLDTYSKIKSKPVRLSPNQLLQG